jgi:hypothetical protein
VFGDRRGHYRGDALAVDGKAATREAARAHAALPLYTTQDVVVLMIRKGILTVAAAAAIKLPSFAELV